METLQKRFVQLTNPITSGSSDINSPFTFKEWFKNYSAVDPAQELLQYNIYLTNWYTRQQTERDNTLNALQLRFLLFLRQVQIFFPNTDVLKWYDNIDFSNERELLIAIPYFAKKLKDIALYYKEVRQYVKDSKIRNSIVGTEISLIKGVQQKLINTFAKKQFNEPVVINNDIWNAVPELSALRENLKVTITEMYDDNTYFDGALESSLLSAVSLVSESDAAAFLQTKNLTLSASDWLYTSILNIDDTSNNLIPADRRSLLKGLLKQVLTSDIYSVSTVSAAPASDMFTFNFDKGKNFTYWPIGPYKKTSPKYYKPLALSASGLAERGTPSVSLSSADTIFIKTKRGVQGAWLTLYPYSSAVSSMQASVAVDTDTVFKFPYPGYGLSALDVVWTKPTLSSDPNFAFMADEEKQSVERAYWDFVSNTVSCVSININDSTLANYAKSSIDYLSADRVRTWDSIPSIDSKMYSGNINEAWLYTFTTTDIPVSASHNTLVYWPYTVIDPDTGIPNNAPRGTSDVCSTISVSSLLQPGMVAGDTPLNSDLIFKISNIYDPVNTITEGSWLCGVTAHGDNCTYIKQPGFNLYAPPGVDTHFVWTGSNTPLSSVFCNTEHAKECDYYVNNLSYKEVSACKCNQVFFNSFGHPGDSFDEYNRLADSIALIEASASNIDLSVWVGRDGKSYQQSKNFSWYKVPTKQDWGTGQWTGNMVLSTGCCYSYNRVDYNDLDTSLYNLPYLRTLYKHSFNISDFKWKSLQKNSDLEWLSDAGVNSKMQLYPGNILNFIHRTSKTFYYTSSTQTQTEVKENHGSVWVNYDYISVNNSNPVLITLPNSIALIPSEQQPSFDLTKVLNTTWSIRRPDGTVDMFNRTPLVAYTPQTTGVFTISVTAEVLSDITTVIAFSSDELFTYNNQINPLSSDFKVFSGVPSLTAIMPYQTDTATIQVSTTTSGYTLNQPLTGWYGRSMAKPFWSKGRTDLNSVESFGNFRQFDAEKNIITQPAFSDIVFGYNTRVQIINNNKNAYRWIQPVVMLSAGERIVWNSLDINYINFNLSATTQFNTLVASTSALHTPSQLEIEVEVLNEPVELYYNAQDPFTWSVSLTTDQVSDSTRLTLTNIIGANKPYLNILNKFVPTIATYPLISNLQASDTICEYLKPKALGVTAYTGREVSFTVNQSSGIFSYNNYYPIGGYGLGENQKAFYTITTEDSTWLKEPIVSQAGAGNISKYAYRTAQKFIPYQSIYETSNLQSVGIVNPNSKQSPWDDTETTKWGDSTYTFTNLPGVVNTNTWASKQILKHDSYALDKWCSDIYGNQYGLYIGDGISTIWCKTQQQNTKSTYEILSGVFNKYNQNVFFDKLNVSVEAIEVFLDTLYVKLDNVIFFERLYYNEVDDVVYNNYDDAVSYTLTPFSTNLQNYIENTQNLNIISDPWYVESDKKVLLATYDDSIVRVIEYSLHAHTSKILIEYTNISSIENFTEFNIINNITVNIDSSLNNINILLWGDNIKTTKQLVVLTFKYTTVPVLLRSVCYIENNMGIEKIYVSSPLHFEVEASSLPKHIPLELSENYDFKVNLLTDVATCSGNVVSFNETEPGVYYIPFKIISKTDIYNTITVKVI